MAFYSAIRKAYPDIQIISNCDGSSKAALDTPADFYDYHVSCALFLPLYHCLSDWQRCSFMLLFPHYDRDWEYKHYFCRTILLLINCLLRRTNSTRNHVVGLGYVLIASSIMHFIFCNTCPLSRYLSANTLSEMAAMEASLLHLPKLHSLQE